MNNPGRLYRNGSTGNWLLTNFDSPIGQEKVEKNELGDTDKSVKIEGLY